MPVQGGIEEALPIPNASRATYSPDGAHRLQPARRSVPAVEALPRRHASQIWLYSAKDHAVEKIPQPAARANDIDPMWIGDTVYFRSDRDGEFNLFAFDPQTKQVTQLTRHTDFPVLTPPPAAAGSSTSRPAPAPLRAATGGAARS